MPRPTHKPPTSPPLLQRFRSDYHLTVVCALGLIIALAITPFALYRAWQGQWLVFFVDVVIVLFSVGTALYAWLCQESKKAAWVLATAVCVAFCISAYTNTAVTPYWLYCMVLFTFSLVPPRLAMLLSALSFSAVIIQPDLFESSVDQATFVVSLVTTILFSYIFAVRNQYQRNALISMAHTDALTQTGNRRSFTQAVEAALVSVQRPNHTATLALFDIDHFKHINDTYGHDVGDAALVHVSQVISHNIRANDQVFRVGGEEFCVLLEGIAHNTAKTRMDKLRKILADCEVMRPICITVSAGITPLMSTDTLASGLKRADNALYQAKAQGRNQVVYTEPTAP